MSEHDYGLCGHWSHNASDLAAPAIDELGYCAEHRVDCTSMTNVHYETPLHTSPPSIRTLIADSPLAVGSGAVVVTRDGVTVWEGDAETSLVRDVTRLARTDTIVHQEHREHPHADHDWRIAFNEPLRRHVYQRQPFGRRWRWVLIETGNGFA